MLYCQVEVQKKFLARSVLNCKWSMLIQSSPLSTDHDAVLKSILDLVEMLLLQRFISNRIIYSMPGLELRHRVYACINQSNAQLL